MIFSGKGEEALWRDSKLIHEAPRGSIITFVKGDNCRFLVSGPTHAPYWVDFDGVVSPVEWVDPAAARADDAPTLPEQTP